MSYSRFSFIGSNEIKTIILVIGFSLLFTFSTNYLFVSEGLYIQTFEKQIAIERITKMIEVSQKWQWLAYVFTPMVIIFRVGFTATCLYTGLFVAELKVRFRDLFKVAVLADFVFVAAGIAKLLILIFFKEVNTLDDLQFQPLSLMQLFDKSSVDAMLVYPLSLLNVFEVLYWLALAWLLTEVVEQPLGSTLKTVASSYGSGLLLWVLFVMFLTVNMT
jgi:hypothetical protein